MTILDINLSDINWQALAAWVALAVAGGASYVHVLIKISTLNIRVNNNDIEHEKIRKELVEYRKQSDDKTELVRQENREDHLKIFDKIDNLKDDLKNTVINALNSKK